MRAAKAATASATHSERERSKSRRRNAVRVKIISMGDAGVGKSCIIKRYCEEKFVSKYIGTIGVDYGVKAIQVGDTEARVNLWDLAGSPDYVEVRNEFYKDAQGCILVYDTTDRASFEALGSWVEESVRYGARDPVVVVAGNKTDVNRRVVSENEGRAWASTNGFLFFEVSAASGSQIRAMFTSLFARVLASVPGIPEGVASAAAALDSRGRV
mmetsp:Transcript_4021/g.12569  ORF Transcript_4021/g.12569 Transcript_4021/m.12569 type:complete len:213 (+) Transcript_4021:329-967(+)